jgi:sulfite oxidase
MISRRAWLATAAHLGVGGAIARWAAPFDVLSQGRGPIAVSDRLMRRSLRPPDYETPVALLDSFITPNDVFFVRSHLPVPPMLDEQTWTLSITGSVSTPLSLPLDEIKKLPPTTISVTLECAGNGRAFFEPPVAGIQWEKGAVGTARWTGVRLADLLRRAGVKPGAKNIVMTPADQPLGTMPAFIRQVPIAKAMHPDTLLAYEMTGAPIPAVHGFPLRAIVPGWEGAYSVKWLTSLEAIDADSDSFWVATAYRYPNRRVAPGATVDAGDMLPLRGLAVKSLITRPATGATLAPGTVNVAGFAWAGEADIARVDVSTDSGARWQPARLVGERTKYTWRRFEYSFAATQPASHLILSRATDSNGVTQPVVSAWNPSGYLWNQYDSVRVEVSNTPAAAPPAAATRQPTGVARVAEGPGANTYTACTVCHESDMVDQQRLTRTGWQREVEKMMRWGARVRDAEKESLVDYLLSRTAKR